IRSLFALADVYVVLRDGQAVKQGLMGEVDEQQLVNMMVGRDLAARVRFPDRITETTVIRVDKLSLAHPDKEGMLLDNLSFDLVKGEIMGVFGLMGAGRTELLETLFGLRGKPLSGSFSFYQHEICMFSSTNQALRISLALVPDVRKGDGSVLEMDVRSNLHLSVLSSL